MQPGLDGISAQDLRDRGGRDERHRAQKISCLPSPAQLERDSGAPLGTGNSQTSLADQVGDLVVLQHRQYFIEVARRMPHSIYTVRHPAASPKSLNRSS
jgi:hypothetical protein